MTKSTQRMPRTTDIRGHYASLFLTALEPFAAGDMDTVKKIFKGMNPAQCDIGLKRLVTDICSEGTCDLGVAAKTVRHATSWAREEAAKRPKSFTAQQQTMFDDFLHAMEVIEGGQPDKKGDRDGEKVTIKSVDIVFEAQPHWKASSVYTAGLVIVMGCMEQGRVRGIFASANHDMAAA